MTSASIRRLLLPLLLLLPSGCGGGAGAGDEAGPSPGGAGAANGGASGSGGGGEVGIGGSTPVTFPRPCSDLYDESLLPTFAVELAASDWAALGRDCEAGVKQYHPVTFRYGAESVPAMIRLKGNWSWNCDKMQFVISFNETDADARFHGLRKLVLDAPWYDPTVLHERVAFEFMKAYGAPSSCVNNARLEINGEYYGLFANVERVDREYLERQFEDPSGNLFGYDADEGLELKTNEDTGSTTTAEAFWAATSLTEVQSLVEVSQAIEIWAGLAMVPDPDSYWAGVEINFHLYEHPTRGLLFLPYDMDIAFAEDLWPELVSADPITYEHPEWRRERAYELVLSDPHHCQAFVAALERARAAYDVAALESKIDQWSAQIAAAVTADPNRQYTIADHEAALTAMRSFPRRRAEFVDAWLAAGGHCPPTWPNGATTDGRP